jgi:hypothetical protein
MQGAHSVTCQSEPKVATLVVAVSERLRGLLVGESSRFDTIIQRFPDSTVCTGASRCIERQSRGQHGNGAAVEDIDHRRALPRSHQKNKPRVRPTARRENM